jgi:hypothetical protein
VVGNALGLELGPALGDELGYALGISVGESLEVALGVADGDKLMLGAPLGAGLLLGGALGDSVGHVCTTEFGDGVFDPSLQIPMCAIALGPYISTLTFVTKTTSTTMFLYDFGPTGETTNVRVALSESETSIQTSSTIFTKPISTNSSTGVANWKVITPPFSFALGVGFPPVC